MFSGNQGPRHKIYAESLGALTYLTKPIKLEVLLGAVKEALKVFE